MNLTVPRRWVKKGLLTSGTVRLASRFTPASAAILAYHSVQDNPQEFASTIGVSNIHPTAIFRRQMELLASKFNPVSLDDIVQFTKGEKRLPPRAVAVTFDDAYLDNYELAAPILNHFGIQGAFYAISGSIGGGKLPWFMRLRHAFRTTRVPAWRSVPDGKVCSFAEPRGRGLAFLAACNQGARLVNQAQEEFVRSIENSLESSPPASDHLMMNWDHLQRLCTAGHIVGAHTTCHPNMAYLTEEDAHREFADSKSRLEQKLGTEVRHFSYPHPALDPNYTTQTALMSQKIGFASAVTTIDGPVFKRHSPWMLPRLYTLSHLDDFHWHLEYAFLSKGKGTAYRDSA